MNVRSDTINRCTSSWSTARSSDPRRRPVSEQLVVAGVDVTLPDLRASIDRWRHFVHACIAHLPDHHHVLVGHSGAGAVLPAIAQPHTTGYLFVDATLPPRSSALPTGKDRLAYLHSIARDGLLPPWSEIMGSEVMEQLLPDPHIREEIEQELPRPPVAYFQDEIPVPDGWDERYVAYLQLSPLYTPLAEEARARGHPVDVMEGGHLHMVVDPVGVSDKIRYLLPH